MAELCAGVAAEVVFACPGRLVFAAVLPVMAAVTCPDTVNGGNVVVSFVGVAPNDVSLYA